MASTAKGSEEVKKLAEAKAKLEKRIQELEGELEHLKSVLEVVNLALTEKSFRRVEVPPPTVPVPPPKVPELPPPTPPPVEYKRVVPLKTATGKVLAEMHVGDDLVRVVPSEGVSLNVNTPPFQAFLISRILEPMQVKDKDAVRTGEIPPEKALLYEVVQEGDLIREITIRNYRDPRRLQEIKTSLRWTLDKMYEKISKGG